MDNILQNRPVGKSLLSKKASKSSKLRDAVRIESLHSKTSAKNLFPEHSASGTLEATTILRSPEGKHHAKLGHYAANLWKEKAMTDVLIVVQNCEFKAHKAVLACHSPYFAEVLVKPGFSDVHYLQLPSVTAQAFSNLLEYMYTGQLKVTCQQLSEVYRAARNLGMKDALKKCLELIHVTSENFQNMVYLFVTSRKLDLLDSSARAFKLMVEHFERLVMTKEFLDLDKEQVMELFGADRIGARSEVIVFLAALKWINHSFLDREQDIPDVLGKVRFSLMTTEEILACYHPPVLPGIVKIAEINQMLLDSTCYILAKSLGQESLFSHLAHKPRSFMFEGEPMMLWDLTVFEEDKFKVNRENLAATRIQASIRGHLARRQLKENFLVAHLAATVIQSAFRGHYTRKAVRMRKELSKERASESDEEQGAEGEKTAKASPFSRKALKTIIAATGMPQPAPLMHVMGAFDSSQGEKGKNVIFYFDIQSKKLTQVTKCPSPRHDARMLSTDEALYIIGGCNPINHTSSMRMVPLTDCHKFVYATKKWKDLPDMKYARSLHGATVFNGRILVIGGKDEDNVILTSIEEYDPVSNTWGTFMVPLPEPRMSFGVATSDSIVWIAGGITSDNGVVSVVDTVICFDKNCGRWYKRTRLPQPTSFPVLLVDRRRVFCVGGAIRTESGDDAQLESVRHVYKLEDNGKWEPQPSMLMQCHSVVAACSEGNLYVFGGFSTQSMSQMTEPIYFDCKERKWSTLCSLPPEAAGFLVTVAKYQI